MCLLNEINAHSSPLRWFENTEKVSTDNKEGENIMEYNYLDAVKEDVRNYIDENKDEILEAVNYEEGEDVDDYMDEIAEYLNDTLWAYDGVTGNASGSYWFNAWKAEEAICHNLDELEEACDELGSDMGEVLKQGAESADVTIRCYLLGRAISEELDENGF